MKHRRWRSLTVGVLLLPLRAEARDLADVFKDPAFVRLGLASLGPALATTVASSYPAASASASVTYLYNPALDALERQTGVAGPLFGERAETIGRGRVNLGVAYSYIHLDTVNGDDLGELPSRRKVAGRVLFVSVPNGVTLQDGRFTNFLPAAVVADIGVQAHQLATTLTYGITPDLDVNLTVPLLVTSLDVTAHGRAPDPRFPQFAVANGQTFTLDPSDSARATGVGDVLVRGKYVLRTGWPVDVAAGLALKLPSGNEDDFQGAGTTRVEPTLILSRMLGGRVEPMLNLGVELNANDVDRSVFRWAVGGTAEIMGPLTAAVTFLGRNEFQSQAAKIPAPFFFQIERNNIYDSSIGFRCRFLEQGLVSVNAVVPLNRDGLRADVIPTLAVEYAF